MSLKTLTKVFTPSLLALAIIGCGSDRPPMAEPSPPPAPVEPTEPAQPDPVGQQVTLDQAVEHITLSQATEYYVELEEDAETLVISFAQGMAGESLNDPDLYVRYGESATLEAYDCASLRSPGTNETCIIDKPKAGVYQILVDPFLQDGAESNTVSDATLWASTTLLPNNRACNDGLSIRGQAMNDTDMDGACGVINQAKDQFHNLFANISPAPMAAIDGDLNEVTGLTIFSSLSNHEIWMPYLNNSDNRSGIYYETAPTEAYHSSEIYTFNAIEWTGGLTVYRSLAHEYIHALDGRYNKEGGYNRNTAWWTEGLAEYVTYVSPYSRFEDSLAETQYTLSDIFQTHNNGYNASPYTWGTLAVAFFIQEHPTEVTNMLTLMRNGEWEAWDALMVTWADTYQEAFAQWVKTGPKNDFVNSAVALELDNYQHVEGRGGWLFSVEVPEDASSFTVNISGGSSSSNSMDVDMLVSKDQVPHWSFADSPQCAPYKEGNEETCTFTDVTPGTYYITLDVYNTWAADITDVYVSACTGADCSVELPEPKPLVQAEDRALPVEPLPPSEATQLDISSCDLLTPYSRTSDQAIITVRNTTDTPVTLYWISYETGQPSTGNAYATLAQGEEYTADFWVIGDRMMLADGNNDCLGVADLSTSNNLFVIDESLFGG